MYHPDILRAYLFRRVDQRMLPVDACTETAEWFGVDVSALAQWLISLDLSTGARRLHLL